MIVWVHVTCGAWHMGASAWLRFFAPGEPVGVFATRLVMGVSVKGVGRVSVR